MPKQWNLSEAKAQLSKVIQYALDGEPQRIVRGGREAVVVLSEAEYTRVAGPRRNLVDLFSALRGSGLEFPRDQDAGREVDI